MSNNRNINTMTVGELKELLEQYDDDTLVVFGYNYGDYWRTTVFGTINDAEESDAKYSEYHQMFKEASSEEEDDDNADEEDYEPSKDEDTINVLVLK